MSNKINSVSSCHCSLQDVHRDALLLFCFVQSNVAKIFANHSIPGFQLYDISDFCIVICLLSAVWYTALCALAVCNQEHFDTKLKRYLRTSVAVRCQRVCLHRRDNVIQDIWHASLNYHEFFTKDVVVVKTNASKRNRSPLTEIICGFNSNKYCHFIMYSKHLVTCFKKNSTNKQTVVF